jgi:formamidopyrimidine-DNA glycosylase
MPELPEVEVLRRSLEPLLVGDHIARVEVRHRGLREPLAVRRLQALKGRRITALRRRAKYLLIDVEGDRTVVVHLGMSGRLTVAPARRLAEAHEHLAIHLRSRRKLRFRDPRRFGLVLALPTSRLAEDVHFAHLGVEPLAGDFSGVTLARAAAGRRGPVKSLLMDATVVVGIGNIYASETLHQAGVHPDRSVSRISAARWEALATAAVAVLEAAIHLGGTTLNDFSDGEGREGENQESLAVYGRAGLPCPRCGRPIRRLVQAGRSTYYCPGCQR